MKSEVKENKVDFSLIRYSQCWEDTEVLLESLDIKEKDVCFGILSAGDNVFSMLAENPEKVVALDISFPQIALAKLKREIFKNFDYEEMLEFMGVKNSLERIGMYEKIREKLEKDVRDYWDLNREAIETGVIHIGKFEKFFKIFREKILPLIHNKKRVEGLFEKKSRQEREEYYNKYWNNFRWKLMFKLFLSKSVVGKFGRDKEFFRYAEKDISEEMNKRSRYALCELDSYENPYIHYIMMGNYRLDCLPYFLRRENFENIKKNAILAYWNLIVERNSSKLDYKENEMKENIENGKNNIWKNFQRMEEFDKKLHKKDKTFFYTDFVVEKVIKYGNN